MNFKIIAIIFFLLPISSWGKLKVITTTPDLKWLVKEIGGDLVIVESLLNGTEDPHYLDAMPHFIGKVADADMFCLVGMELEVGWAPKILSRSGNTQVQPGGKGYCDVGKSVKALDVPVGKIDRSQGDVHPGGNPHYHLGPNFFLEGGEGVLDTLLALDPKNANAYLNNFEKLKVQIKNILKKVTQILKPIKNKVFMEYHKEFSYFFHEYGLNNQGAIEEIPGVPPSAGRLARVGIKAKASKIDLVVAAHTSPLNILKKFNEISKVSVLRLPLGLRSEGKLSSYKYYQVYVAQKILKAISSSEK